MTRIFTDGAEFGDILALSAYSGAVTASATTARSGNYSYRLGNSMDATISFTAAAEYYFRAGIRMANQGTTRYLQWRKGTTNLGGVAFTVDGKVSMYVGTTLTDTSVWNSFQLNTWYLLEVYVKIADSPNGRVIIKLDGVTMVDFTGDSKPGADTTMDNIFIQFVGTTGYCYFDDLGINNTSGGSDDSWCGDGKIVCLTPDGNGTYSQFIGSDGNSVDNYLLVDETPPDDDTSYVETTVSGDKDSYEMSDYTGVGRSILRVWTEARARDTVAAGGQIKLGFITDGSEYESSALSLLTTYSRVVGTGYTQNPYTVSGWAEADLDGVQTLIEAL
jgi:hypothetical protein